MRFFCMFKSYLIYFMSRIATNIWFSIVTAKFSYFISYENFNYHSCFSISRKSIWLHWFINSIYWHLLMFFSSYERWFMQQMEKSYQWWYTHICIRKWYLYNHFYFLDCLEDRMNLTLVNDCYWPSGHDLHNWSWESKYFVIFPVRNECFSKANGSSLRSMKWNSISK